MRSILFFLSCVFATTAFASPPVTPLMSYGGRLTDASGRPLAGPVDVELRFYDAFESGTLLDTLSFPGTTLKEGVFLVDLRLTGPQAHGLFGALPGSVWVEVQAGTKVYPRQTFYTVPYALKVPIDDQSLEYLNDGTLSVKKQNLGDVTLGGNSTLGLGTLDNAQQAALTGPGGLTAADEGKTWFNSDINQINYWNGSAVVTLGNAGGGIQSLGGLPANNQLLDVNTTGTALAWDSTVDTHTLSIPLASAGAAVSGGLISNGDYTAFSNKVDRSGDTMASLVVTNNVGIGTTTPATKLHVQSPAGANWIMSETLTGTNSAGLLMGNADRRWSVGVRGDASDVFAIADETGLSLPLVIDSGGKVGIGTTSPAFALDLVGSAAFRSTSSQIRLKETDNADPQDAWHLSMNGGKMNFVWEDNSSGPSFLNAMAIDTSGNVGIGSNAPTAKLDVAGTVVATGLKLSTSPSSGHVLTSDGSGNATWQAVPGTTWAAPGAIGATTPGTGAFSGLSIGTTTPGTDLSFGSGADRTIGVQTQATAGNNLTVQAGGTSGSNLNGGDLVLSSGTANGSGSSKVEFKTASGGAPTTSMTILGNGFVGIGTTAPQQLLHLVGAAPRIWIGDQSDTASYVQLVDFGSVSAKLQKVSATGPSILDVSATPLESDKDSTVTFHRQTSTTGLRRVQFMKGDGTSTVQAQIGVAGSETFFGVGGGSVGIGTASPNTSLDVRGNVTLLSGSDIRPTTDSATAINIANAAGVDFASFNTTAKRLQLNADSSSGSGDVLRIAGVADPTEQLVMGFVTSSNYGAIQANSGGSGTALVLNPLGGKVLVGAFSTTSNFDLGLARGADRSIAVDYPSSIDIPGYDLTLASGGVWGGTDVSGGDLILSSGRSTGSAGSAILLQTPTPGASAATFRTPTTKMAVLGNGNVGIGTTVPGALTHLYGTTGSTALRITDTNASGNATLSLQDTGGAGRMYSLVSDTGGNFSVFDATAGASRMAVNASGQVGIGTTSPSAMLEVKGTPGTDGIKFPDATLQKTALGQTTVVQSTSASGSGEVDHFVGCPANYTLTGGGCFTGASAGRVVYSFPASNTTWSCRINNGGSDTTIVAYALCMKYQ